MASYSQPTATPNAEPLLPSPPNIILPQPSATPSARLSSSSRERPHSESNTGKSEHYTCSVKERIQRRHERCWLCSATPVEACHVLSQKDNIFLRLRADGLVCFQELGDEDNAIGLCPTCHRNYDELPEPGFVFLPDLKHLIRFEKADQARRRKAQREQAISLSRIVPTPERYRLEQQQEGTIDADATGGQYRRYVLHDFLPLGLHQQLHNSTREWAGSPTAALQNVMKIIGRSPKGLPPQVREELGELLRLYQWDLGQDSIEHVSSQAECTASGESHEPGNDREISRAGVSPDGQSHETSVNHDSSRSGPAGKRSGGNKRTRLVDHTLFENAPPFRKKRIVQQHHVNRSPPFKFVPDSLPDLINSVDDHDSQGSGPDIGTYLTERHAGQKHEPSFKWGPLGTSNSAIDFVTSINSYAD